MVDAGRGRLTGDPGFPQKERVVPRMRPARPREPLPFIRKTNGEPVYHFS